MLRSCRSRWACRISLASTLVCLPALAVADQWTSLGPQVSSVKAVVVEPRSPSTLYAATTAGLLRSIDSGRNWSLLTNGLPAAEVTAISISTRQTLPGRFRGPPAIYVVAARAPLLPGVYKSIDGGASWQFVILGHTVVADPLREEVVYVINDNQSLIRSRDGGETWEGAGAFPPVCIPNSGCGLSLTDLRIDWTNPNILYIKNRGEQYRTMDGGSSWQRYFDAPASAFTFTAQYRSVSNRIDVTVNNGSTWMVFAGASIFQGQSIIRIYADPQNTTVYAQTSTNLFRTVNGGQSWTRGPAVPQGELAVDPTSPSTIYAGTTWSSLDGGSTWNPLLATAVGGSPRFVAVAESRSSSSVIYSGAVNNDHVLQVFKSSDGGATWSLSNGNVKNAGPNSFAPSFQFELKVDPFDSQVVYLNTGYEILRSADGGVAWIRIDSSIPACLTPLALELSQTTPGDIFAACDYPDYGLGSGVHRSSDRGDHWTQFTPIPSRIVADPVDAGTMYLLDAYEPGVGLSLKKTTDGGTTFQTITTGSINLLAIDPMSHDTLFLAVGTALHKSQDGGTSWTSQQSFASPPTALIVARSSSSLFAVDAEGVKMLRVGESFWTLLQIVGATSLAVLDAQPETVLTDPGLAGIMTAAAASPVQLLFSQDRTSPVVANGASITWTALGVSSQGSGLNDLTYQFWKWNPVGNWELAQDVSSQRTYSWTPAATDAGAHAVQVRVRRQGSTTDEDVETIAFTMVPLNLVHSPAFLVTNSFPEDLQRFLFDYNGDAVKDLLF